MMAVGLPEDLRELLRRLNRGIAELYGERYRGLVLFDSYARGEARKEGSDVDLLVLLKGEVNGWRDYLKIEPVSWPLNLVGVCAVELSRQRGGISTTSKTLSCECP